METVESAKLAWERQKWDLEREEQKKKWELEREEEKRKRDLEREEEQRKWEHDRELRVAERKNALIQLGMEKGYDEAKIKSIIDLVV